MIQNSNRTSKVAEGIISEKAAKAAVWIFCCRKRRDNEDPGKTMKYNNSDNR